MIRILVGSALPILGLGAAAALLGPDLVTGPRGEPMIVAAPAAASIQQASFNGSACASALLLDNEDLPLADPKAGTHIVTLAFRYDPEGGSMEIEKGATNPDADAALVLVFDDQGRILGVAHPPSLRERILAQACFANGKHKAAGI